MRILDLDMIREMRLNMHLIFFEFPAQDRHDRDRELWIRMHAPQNMGIYAHMVESAPENKFLSALKKLTFGPAILLRHDDPAPNGCQKYEFVGYDVFARDQIKAIGALKLEHFQ